jgi:glycosyltransferase involved in cell wall biosynthesis
MKLLLDARYLDGSFSGIGTYSLHLVRTLAAREPGVQLHVLVRPGFRPQGDWGDNVRFVTWPAAPVSFATMAQLGRMVDSLKVDLMHSLFPIAPLRLKTPLLITVHDLQPFVDPEFSARRPLPVQAAYRLFYRFAYPAAMRGAKWILNDSYYTRDSVAELFPEFIPKLIVAYPGLASRPNDSEPEDFDMVSAEHHLENPYLLYYGSTRPNKNLPMLVRAFGNYVRAHPESDVDLVLILKRDRFFRDVARAIRIESLQKRVRVLDQLTDREQHAVLSNARAFAFATRYEGFGFPAIEAMAAGVPVLAGKSGSLAEVCGGAAEMVETEDADDIARGMASVLHDEARRAELIARGRVRAPLFDWNETAARMMDVYRLLF